jgi:hypothetical protein
MPCCAFAVFLVLQLLAPFAVLRRRLFGERDNRNPAAAWRYGEPALAAVPAAARPDRVSWRGKAALIVAAEVLALAGAVWIVRPELAKPADPEDWEALVALHTVWCGPSEPPLKISLKETRQ